MPHDPLVCIEDALKASESILSFTEGFNEETFCSDLKTISAVERQFEIIGEALNRARKIDNNW